MLPDLLSANLKLIICGTAVGTRSALEQNYYAGPGNKFYKILYKSGLTQKVLNPNEYDDLLNYSIGLTDLVKTTSGMDYILRKDHFDVESFKIKMGLYKPKMICFNGKKSARVFMNLTSTSKVFYGIQNKKLGNTKLYIAPSTSGAANGSWNEEYWIQLKDFLG